jgi:hypothetical protein
MIIKLLASATLFCGVCFRAPLVHAMMPQQQVSCEPDRKLLTDAEVLLSKKPKVPSGWKTFAYSERLEIAEKIIVNLNLARVIHASGTVQSEITKQNTNLVEAIEALGARDVFLSGPVVQHNCYRLTVIYTVAN